MTLYDKREIFEQSKKLAKKKKLLFIQDIIDFLPLSKSTFYDYYPDGSDELDSLRKILDENKVAIKSALRVKWYKSDNATLQIALYKLSSNAEEHRKLQQNYTDHTTKGEAITSRDEDLVKELKEKLR